MLPTEEDVAEFRRRGWYISPKIIPDDLLDRADAGAHRYWEGQVDDGPPLDEMFIPVGPPPAGLRKNDFASLRQAALAELVRFPAIGATAARLMGTPEVRLWHDQLLYKPPSAERSPANVGWHTDRSYWKMCSSDNMVTAWVPFHDVTLDHGPLTVVDGSNRWGEEDSDDRLFFEQDLDAGEQRIATTRPGRKIVKVPLVLARGQVSFHHCRTFHGSGPNHTNEPRRSLAIHMQPADNRFSDSRDPDGNPWPHYNNAHCRKVDGVPDYTDPRYCPVLWPQ